jgi:hypothetical protein
MDKLSDLTYNLCLKLEMHSSQLGPLWNIPSGSWTYWGFVIVIIRIVACHRITRVDYRILVILTM